MSFRVTLGIFTGMFWATSCEFWGGLRHFPAIFRVILGIFPGMFWASSGEIWGGCGHFSRDVLG